MKIRTEKGFLVQLDGVAFSRLTFDCLLKLSLSCPNLALDAVEVHTYKRLRVKLYQLEFDWDFANRVNLPNAA